MYFPRSACTLKDAMEIFEKLIGHFGRCDRDAVQADEGAGGTGQNLIEVMECKSRQGIWDVRMILNPFGWRPSNKIDAWAKVYSEVTRAQDTNAVATGGSNVGWCSNPTPGWIERCTGTAPTKCCFWPLGPQWVAGTDQNTDEDGCKDTAENDQTCDKLKSLMWYSPADATKKRCLCNANPMPCADPLHGDPDYSNNDVAYTGGLVWRRFVYQASCGR